MNRTFFLPFALCLFTLSFSGTEWVKTGKSPAYPVDLYFVGVGLSERGADAAKANAVVEVKKQISVQVSGTVLDEMSSETVGGVERARSKSSSRARLTTSGDIQGIQVVETAKSGGIHYALAILEKQNFISNTKQRIQELKGDLKKAMEGAQADVSGGKMGPALQKLSAAKKLIRQILEQRTLMSAAAAVTDAEKLDVTEADVAAVYEKCVSSIKVAKTAGDNQEVPVGGAPEAPFGIAVSADGAPLSGLLVLLRDEKNKVVYERFTDDGGRIDFFLGEEANTSTGSHKYTAELKLSVSGTLEKVLKAQYQTFTYKVISNPCFANVTVKPSPALSAGKADLKDKVVKMLAKYDVVNDSDAAYTVQVSLDAKETGHLQGLSESRTFVKTDLTLTFSLLDGGKEVVTFEKTAKGTGSTLIASVGQGLGNAGIKTDIKLILDKICGGTDGAPKKKIAVFPFKNTSGYADWHNVADALTDMIITKLINTRKFDVVERSMLQKIMEEKALAMSGVVEQNEAVQMAQMAGADLVLVGSASVIGGKIEVDGRVVDAGTGVAKAAAPASGYALDNLRGLADEIVRKIPAVK